MIKEFKAFYDAFQYGKAVANKRAWKQAQNITNNLVGLFGAALVISCGFDYCFPIDPDDLKRLAGGIATAYGIWNTIATTVSTEHAGIKK